MSEDYVSKDVFDSEIRRIEQKVDNAVERIELKLDVYASRTEERISKFEAQIDGRISRLEAVVGMMQQMLGWGLGFLTLWITIGMFIVPYFTK